MSFLQPFSALPRIFSRTIMVYSGEGGLQRIRNTRVERGNPSKAEKDGRNYNLAERGWKEVHFVESPDNLSGWRVIRETQEVAYSKTQTYFEARMGYTSQYYLFVNTIILSCAHLIPVFFQIGLNSVHIDRSYVDIFRTLRQVSSHLYFIWAL